MSQKTKYVVLQRLGDAGTKNPTYQHVDFVAAHSAEAAEREVALKRGESGAYVAIAESRFSPNEYAVEQRTVVTKAEKKP